MCHNTLLDNLGLFLGTSTNEDGTPYFSLGRAPTRAEAVTILVRLMGKEDEALAGTWTTPFTDLPDWTLPYVGYAYTNGYTNGVSDDRFGASSSVSTAQFLTLLLRALGYEDGVDFTWTAPWVLTDQLGITAGQYNEQTTDFLRADAAAVSASALYAPVKGSDTTLLKALLDAGAITGSTVVIWDYSPMLFDEDFASFLFYPVSGSPACFTSFKLDQVTVNGLSCQTLQVTTPEEVAIYMASLGYDVGGFGYVEISYDEAAAKAAAASAPNHTIREDSPVVTLSGSVGWVGSVGFSCVGVDSSGWVGVSLSSGWVGVGVSFSSLSVKVTVPLLLLSEEFQSQ